MEKLFISPLYYTLNIVVSVFAVLRVFSGGREPQSAFARSLLIRVDMIANAVLFGDPQETISGRMGKDLHKDANGLPGFLARLICPVLDKIDRTTDDHCGASRQPLEGSDAVCALCTVAGMGMYAAIGYLFLWPVFL